MKSKKVNKVKKVLEKNHWTLDKFRQDLKRIKNLNIMG